MKIEIRETKSDGIIQITTLDERWYHNQTKGIFRPSSTWIAGYYPKGIQFYKWLANTGWDEAEAIKTAAGGRGSKVHQAIEFLIAGGQVNMDDHFNNPNTKQPEELTVDEWECVMSFAEWYAETKPEIMEFEKVVESEKYNYAGTQDFKCKINGEIWIVDFKTSASIWPEMKLQVSSYKHADGNQDVQKLGILQLNYKLNKIKKFKFTEIEDKFDLFLAARQIWADENENVLPKQKDYPTSLKLQVYAKSEGTSGNAKDSTPIKAGQQTGDRGSEKHGSAPRQVRRRTNSGSGKRPRRETEKRAEVLS